MKPLHLLLAAAALAMAGTAHAESFRCGDRVVMEGDAAAAVRSKCGAPAQVSQDRALLPPFIWREGRLLRLPGQAREVVIDIWTYNFGPDRLMQRLRLEDGVVVEITRLGYGYR